MMIRATISVLFMALMLNRGFAERTINVGLGGDDFSQRVACYQESLLNKAYVGPKVEIPYTLEGKKYCCYKRARLCFVSDVIGCKNGYAFFCPEDEKLCALEVHKCDKLVANSENVYEVLSNELLKATTLLSQELSMTPESFGCPSKENCPAGSLFAHRLSQRFSSEGCEIHLKVGADDGYVENGGVAFPFDFSVRIEQNAMWKTCFASKVPLSTVSGDHRSELPQDFVEELYEYSDKMSGKLFSKRDACKCGLLPLSTCYPLEVVSGNRFVFVVPDGERRTFGDVTIGDVATRVGHGYSGGSDTPFWLELQYRAGGRRQVKMAFVQCCDFGVIPSTHQIFSIETCAQQQFEDVRDMQEKIDLLEEIFLAQGGRFVRKRRSIGDCDGDIEDCIALGDLLIRVAVFGFNPKEVNFKCGFNFEIKNAVMAKEAAAEGQILADKVNVKILDYLHAHQ